MVYFNSSIPVGEKVERVPDSRFVIGTGHCSWKRLWGTVSEHRVAVCFYTPMATRNQNIWVWLPVPMDCGSDEEGASSEVMGLSDHHIWQ
jgi:hypothetical protein